MYMKSESFIQRTGELLFRVTMENKGSSYTKVLTPQQFAECLMHEKESDGKFFQLGNLPATLYDGAISEKGALAAVFVVPAQKRTIVYRKKHYIVPFPSLIFGFSTTSRGAVRDNLCYALMTEKPNDSMELFCYPFGNVSRDGHICFGNIQRDKPEKISDFESWIQDFFESETNDDYYRSDSLNCSGMKQGDLLKKLQKMDSFPNEYLNPTGIKVKQVLETITK